MEFRAGEDSAEGVSRTEGTKTDSEKVYFGCGNESEEPEYNQPKNGAVAPKPSDVRNGDLVSLLLAATPPYLYNIPLVPQTFFFSEMLKSFVQAKTERQNLKAQQSHHRRQRKRHWRDVTPPPKPMPYDKPLELTTPKTAAEEKPPPRREKSPPKKVQQDGGDRKLSELGNFSVEKLANSSIGPEPEQGPGDRLPPAPPLWYPLLYPPHPPYGIDPLHFFIDLRVSAHFWDRTAKLNNETGSVAPPDDSPLPPGGRGRHASAFRVPSPRPRKESPAPPPKERSRNVHYVISSLRDIYRNLEKEVCERTKEEEGEGERGGGEGEEEEGRGDGERKEKKWEKGKDLRALIGLELVVDYVKQESDGEEDKSEDVAQDQAQELTA